jgi:hypothetical protein
MNSKSLSIVALAVAALAISLGAPSRSSGQALGADDPVLTALLNDLTVKQATLDDNQNKIDLKLAAIADTLRLARIYVGRGGGKVP